MSVDTDMVPNWYYTLVVEVDLEAGARARIAAVAVAAAHSCCKIVQLYLRLDKQMGRGFAVAVAGRVPLGSRLADCDTAALLSFMFRHSKA